MGVDSSDQEREVNLSQGCPQAMSMDPHPGRDHSRAPSKKHLNTTGFLEI